MKYNFKWVELSEAWDAWEKDGRGNKGGFRLSWGCEGIGFGTLTFYRTLSGELVCDNETMDRDFIEEVLAFFAKSAILMD